MCLKDDFDDDDMNFCFSEPFLRDFCLAVRLRHGLGAKKQKAIGPLTLQSITGGDKAELILCLAQKDMCQFFFFQFWNLVNFGSAHGLCRLLLQN